MDQFFRKLPLFIKLSLIGFIPLVFLMILAFKFYQEKNAKLNLLESYMLKINLSADLSSLIDAMQNERKISFDYTMGKEDIQKVNSQRPLTNALLLKIENTNDSALSGFREYTSLYRLNEVRNQIDSGKSNPNSVMHYYSNAIFRLNTLNQVSLPNNQYFEPVYKDFASQKLLTEMVTYLGIIRSNIYNVLETKKYMIETLIGLTGTFDVYKSYEKEYRMKATQASLNSFDKISNGSDLKFTRAYLDSLFGTFKFDSTYNADQWWTVSNNGINELSSLQKKIWSRVENQIQSIYNREERNRDYAFALVLLILIVAISLTSFAIISISRMLKKLENEANKIAQGKTQVRLTQDSNDAIGSLTRSIAEIARTNQELALIAEALGKGDFSVEVRPRNEADVLGNAMVQMKNALQNYSEKMESLVQTRTEQLEKSNEDLLQFAHVASHDLKEPLRKIRIYSDRLLEISAKLNEREKEILHKIDQSAGRMAGMIDGILDYSSMNAANENFELVDLNIIVQNVKTDLELVIEQKNASLEFYGLPIIEGAPVLLNQLFYNLINNALKFSRPDLAPVIRISCKKLNEEACLNFREDCFEISISDNGIGFDNEHADKIFNSFSRLHAKNEYEGTGLGLALCRKIILYHHGKIWAEGNREGACFKMVLPQKQESRNLVDN